MSDRLRQSKNCVMSIFNFDFTFIAFYRLEHETTGGDEGARSEDEILLF